MSDMTQQEAYEAKWIAPGVAVLECNACGALVEPQKSDKHSAFHESMRLSPCLQDWLNLFASMGGPTKMLCPCTSSGKCVGVSPQFACRQDNNVPFADADRGEREKWHRENRRHLLQQ